MIGNLDTVAGADVLGGDEDVFVQQRPVGGTKILDNPMPTGVEHTSVQLGDSSVIDYNPAARRVSDDGFALDFEDGAGRGRRSNHHNARRRPSINVIARRIARTPGGRRWHCARHGNRRCSNHPMLGAQLDPHGSKYAKERQIHERQQADSQNKEERIRHGLPIVVGSPGHSRAA